MFGFIRVIIGCIFLVFWIFLIKKSKIIHKQILYFIFTAISVGLITILAFLPFENYIYSFKSAEDVYKYYYFLEEKPELVIEGENSDFVVGAKNTTSKFLIVPKTENGWKIGIGLNAKKIIQKISNKNIIYVYQYKNTNDYFLTVFNAKGEKITILDDYGTKFYPLERKTENIEKTYITYYGYISDFNPEYNLMVNGDKIIWDN